MTSFLVKDPLYSGFCSPDGGESLSDAANRAANLGADASYVVALVTYSCWDDECVTRPLSSSEKKEIKGIFCASNAARAERAKSARAKEAKRAAAFAAIADVAGEFVIAPVSYGRREKRSEIFESLKVAVEAARYLDDIAIVEWNSSINSSMEFVNLDGRALSAAVEFWKVKK